MFEVVQSPGTDLRRGSGVSVARLNRVVLIGNFPPRRCGIATFTADLRGALAEADESLAYDIVAMHEPERSYDYPEAVTSRLRDDSLADYAETARSLNRDGVQLACVQHEFGIFGGPAGSHLLTLLNGLACPVVTTLHTVLENPNDDQMQVMKQLIARSARLVVMSPKGRDILMRVYDTPRRKIEVIPHGAPDRPLLPTAAAKKARGLAGRDVILTFGLLSPNKGLESAIRALPRIVAARPAALYVIAGATHPHLLAREGEAYRESLQALAEELGVAKNIRFVNAYLGADELLDYLEAADVYVTPYLNPAQITSGTLAFAVALGKPVVSTPYWHAAELLDDGAGMLTPFGDTDAIGAAVTNLLEDEVHRAALAKRAYARGRSTIWPRVGERYIDLFQSVFAEHRAKPQPKRVAPAIVSMRAVERMSDSCGMFQHGRFAVPDRHHGYCVDDNARALIFTQRAGDAGLRDSALERLAYIYAAFVEHAWNPDNKRFRNFMAYDRSWLEDAGSNDSFGRAFWSVGETAARAHDPELRRWALHLGARVIPHLHEIGSLRATAFNVLGLCGLAAANAPGARPALERAATHVLDFYKAHSRSDWRWFEPCLTYDNARLPEALLRASMVLDAPDLCAAGLESLAWLCDIHTAPSGHFRPVGSTGFHLQHCPPAAFDQQPLEAAAAVDAAWAAFEITADAVWKREAQRAFAWYCGGNDLGVRIGLGETGGCYDGLAADGVNRNQGAESILSYQLAACAMRARELLPQATATC